MIGQKAGNQKVELIMKWAILDEHKEDVTSSSPEERNKWSSNYKAIFYFEKLKLFNG